jgi:hypothetical protein
VIPSSKKQYPAWMKKQQRELDELESGIVKMQKHDRILQMEESDQVCKLITNRLTRMMVKQKGFLSKNIRGNRSRSQ